MAAAAEKTPAVTQTYRNDSKYAAFRPSRPAAMAAGVTSGIVASASISCEESAAMNAGKSSEERPNGSAFSLISRGRAVVSFELKMALSGS